MNKGLASVALAAAILTLGAEAQSRDVRKTLPLSPDGRVSIHTFKGTVEVKTWNQPQVEIFARIEADPDGENQAERVRLTEIQIRGGDSSVRIESDYTEAQKVKDWFFGDGSTLPNVRYTVRVPQTVSVEIHDHKSDIRVSDLQGDLEIDTHKGRVEISGQQGAVELSTHKGEVEAAFSSYSKSSTFSTHKGDIRIDIPSNSRFSIDADTSRRATLRSEFPMQVDAGEERMRATVNGGGPELNLSTHKGSIQIRKK